MSVRKKVYRLRSAVALVFNAGVLELFDSNERISLRIEISYPLIIPLLQEFDGVRSVSEFASLYPGNESGDLEYLIEFLNQKFILIEVDSKYDVGDYEVRPRLYNQLEGYFKTTSEVKEALFRLDCSHVVVVGVGGVGSWIIQSLASVGVKNITILDDDLVELSNIHRQDFFRPADVGRLKASVVANSVLERYGVSCTVIPQKMIDIESLAGLGFDPSLIINCADWPSVDVTSELISRYCIPKGIPHVIGGGYNLHLTLIGQAVLPGRSACFKCFEIYFNRENYRELLGVKKLHRDSRKIGSFGPACSLSASVTALECLKILLSVPLDKISIINKRLEFNFSSFDFSATEIPSGIFCGECGWGGL